MAGWVYSPKKRGSIWLGLGTKIHPVAREGQLHAGATPPRGDVCELFAAKMAPDMDVDMVMESRDDVVLETSPECVGATDEASAQNEGMDQLSSGEGDPPMRGEHGVVSSKVITLPKTAQRPPYSHPEPYPKDPIHMAGSGGGTGGDGQ